LNRNLDTLTPSGRDGLLQRVKRNLARILDMQYQLEDIQDRPDDQAYHMLSVLLDTCRDELESLVAETAGEKAVDRIRRRLDEVFGSSKLEMEHMPLGEFVKNHLDKIRPLFSHRHLEFRTDITECGSIRIPSDILIKIIVGLVKNAVEYTPDGGCVSVKTHIAPEGPVLIIEDTGVGITDENQRLIFENYFTTSDILQYSTGSPYDFNAGGRGFDLLRMKIFSERYHFKIQMDSVRCRYLLDAKSSCPGRIETCEYCSEPADCSATGGTRFWIQFLPESESLDLF
jgi:signal transduction histidine kinase